MAPSQKLNVYALTPNRDLTDLTMKLHVKTFALGLQPSYKPSFLAPCKLPALCSLVRNLLLPPLRTPRFTALSPRSIADRRTSRPQIGFSSISEELLPRPSSLRRHLSRVQLNDPDAAKHLMSEVLGRDRNLSRISGTTKAEPKQSHPYSLLSQLRRI